MRSRAGSLIVRLSATTGLSEWLIYWMYNAGQTATAKRFAKPAIAAEIKKTQYLPIQRKLLSGVKMYGKLNWRDYRKTVSESNSPAHIMILATNEPEFCLWLCHF